MASSLKLTRRALRQTGNGVRDNVWSVVNLWSVDNLRSVVARRPVVGCRLAEGLAPLPVDPASGSLSFATGLPYDESHRHFSHAMALHPLGVLSVEAPRDSAIIRATLDVIAQHGTEWWTGYSFSWFSAMLARAGRGEDALRYLETYRRAFILRNGSHANGDGGHWIERVAAPEHRRGVPWRLHRDGRASKGQPARKTSGSGAVPWPARLLAINAMSRATTVRAIRLGCMVTSRVREHMGLFAFWQRYILGGDTIVHNARCCLTA